jgi:hypothetical protein
MDTGKYEILRGAEDDKKDSMEMPRFWRPISQISQERFVKEALFL